MGAMTTHSLSGKLDHLFAGGVVDSHNRLQRVPTLSQNHKALLACNEHRERPVRLEQVQLRHETCLHTGLLATPVTADASHLTLTTTVLLYRVVQRRACITVQVWMHAVAFWSYTHTNY